MNKLTKCLMMILLLFGLCSPNLMADDGNTYNIDIDTDEIVAAQVGLGLLITGGVFYFVREAKKKRKAKQEGQKTSSVIRKKPKLDLHVDLAPQQRSLTTSEVDIDYRLGFSIKF